MIHYGIEKSSKSSENQALWIRRFKMPVIISIGALIIYARLGVPAMCYSYTGNSSYHSSSRCIDLLGNKHEFYGSAPLIFFIKDGRITFP